MTGKCGIFGQGVKIHDLLLFSLLLCLLFVIGQDLGAPDREEEVDYLLALEEYGDLPGDTSLPLWELSLGQELSVDGKWKISYLGASGGLYYFACRGYLTPSGFLLSGAKYLSENQPITVTVEELSFRGKIMLLSKI